MEKEDHDQDGGATPILEKSFRQSLLNNYSAWSNQQMLILNAGLNNSTRVNEFTLDLKTIRAIPFQPEGGPDEADEFADGKKNKKVKSNEIVEYLAEMWHVHDKAKEEHKQLWDTRFQDWMKHTQAIQEQYARVEQRIHLLTEQEGKQLPSSLSLSELEQELERATTLDSFLQACGIDKQEECLSYAQWEQVYTAIDTFFLTLLLREDVFVHVCRLAQKHVETYKLLLPILVQVSTHEGNLFYQQWKPLRDADIHLKQRRANLNDWYAKLRTALLRLGQKKHLHQQKQHVLPDLTEIQVEVHGPRLLPGSPGKTQSIVIEPHATQTVELHEYIPKDWKVAKFVKHVIKKLGMRVLDKEARKHYFLFVIGGPRLNPDLLVCDYDWTRIKELSLVQIS